MSLKHILTIPLKKTDSAKKHKNGNYYFNKKTPYQRLQFTAIIKMQVQN